MTSWPDDKRILPVILHVRSPDQAASGPIIARCGTGIRAEIVYHERKGAGCMAGIVNADITEDGGSS